MQSTASSPSNSESRLSAAALGGIGAGIFVVVITAILAVVFYNWKKRQIKRAHEPQRAGTAQLDMADLSQEINEQG